MRRLALAAALVLAACGSDSQQPDPPDPDPPPVPAPDEGMIRVRADTAGAWVQSGQYVVVLDGAQTRQFVSPGTIGFTSLIVAPGTYAVSLAGLPPWCSAGAAPLSVEVPAESVVDATFTVTCTGVWVTTATAGAALDPDGYVLVVDGAAWFGLNAPNGTQVVGVAPGRRVLTLDGLAPHCRPARPSWEIDVTPEGRNPIRLDVTCASARLAAEITTTGSDLDVDGYSGALETSALPAGAWIANWGITEMNFGALGAGTDWTVSLSEVSPNCRVEEPVRRGTVAEADTLVLLRFAVSCSRLPAPGILLSMLYDDPFWGTGRQADRWVDDPATPQPFRVGVLGGAEWSPDGTMMAFEAWDAEGDVSVRSRDSAERQRLGPGSQPVFTPDGRGVLYLAPTRRGILRVDLPGGAPTTVLSSAVDIVAFDLSPDGGRIAMVLGSASPVLVIANADGSAPRELRTSVSASRPRFSPDGTEILAQEAGNAFATGEWFTVRTDGSGVRGVGPFASTAAAWSPDGSRIVFSQNGNPSRLVSVRRSDGGDERVLTEFWPAAPVVSISWR